APAPHPHLLPASGEKGPRSRHLQQLQEKREPVLRASAKAECSGTVRRQFDGATRTTVPHGSANSFSAVAFLLFSSSQERPVRFGLRWPAPALRQLFAPIWW